MAYARVIAAHDIPNALIRAYLHAQFGHALYVLDERGAEGEELALQCVWPAGVEIVGLRTVKDFRHVDFTFDGIEDAIAYGKTLLGAKYDLSNIAGFVFDPALHNPNELICSRFLVETAAYGAKNPLFDPQISFWHIAPGVLPACYPRGKKILDVWPVGLLL